MNFCIPINVHLGNTELGVGANDEPMRWRVGLHLAWLTVEIRQFSNILIVLLIAGFIPVGHAFA
jgi:hypothetical protein